MMTLSSPVSFYFAQFGQLAIVSAIVVSELKGQFFSGAVK